VSDDCAAVTIEAAHYLAGDRVETGDPWEHRGDGGFTWVTLHQPEASDFVRIQTIFDLHELAVEDAVEAGQRPKLERYDQSIFVALTAATIADPPGQIQFAEVQAFVADDFVVLVTHGQHEWLSDLRSALEAKPEALATGPMTVLHAVMDRIVDGYEPVVEGLGDAVEVVEEDVFSANVNDPSESVYELKRDVLRLLGAMEPMISPLTAIIAGRAPVEGDPAYFRDVLDNLTRAVDRVETYRELLTSVFQANLAQLSVRLAEVAIQQNEDMRRISAWVAMGAAPAVIAGIYGMNFTHMPALDWVGGYPLALGVMGLTSLVLYRSFRRSGWL